MTLIKMLANIGLAKILTKPELGQAKVRYAGGKKRRPSLEYMHALGIFKLVYKFTCMLLV